MEHQGYPFPRKRVVVNVHPVETGKDPLAPRPRIIAGSLDVAIALAILDASGQAKTSGMWAYGELQLDGGVRPARGTEAALLSCPVPLVVAEATPSIPTLPHRPARVSWLEAAMEAWSYAWTEAWEHAWPQPSEAEAPPQLAPNQALALELVVKCAQPVILRHRPGAGALRLVRHVAHALGKRPTTQQELRRRLVTYSLAGLPMTTRAPLRCPHHTVSLAGMRGRPPFPGELALARGGILYLDEAAEFSSSVLELVAQQHHKQPRVLGLTLTGDTHADQKAEDRLRKAFPAAVIVDLPLPARGGA
jgi:magnesium chelatase family protein